MMALIDSDRGSCWHGEGFTTFGWGSILLWVGIFCFHWMVQKILQTCSSADSIHQTFTKICAFHQDTSECIKSVVCPKRRARWLKCAKRCRRNARACPCPIESALRFYKLHLPSPLPFQKHKKRAPSPPPPAVRSLSDSDSSLEYVRSPSPPVTSLIDQCRMQNWDAILEYPISKRAARYRDGDGLLALHWACSGGPPVDVVERLLEVYPSAARKVDAEGSTPLHFAAHYRAAIPVMEALIRVYPEAVSAMDRYGRTPLYHAVEKESCRHVLDLMASSNPSLITTAAGESTTNPRTAGTRTPLFVVWVTAVVDQRTREHRRGKKWDKAVQLLQSAYRHRFGLETPNLLVAAIRMDVYLPEQAIGLILEANPSLVKDTSDGIPLHVAASAPSYSLARTKQLFSLLLKKYPHAANLRDDQGRSTLSLALEAGLPWSVVKVLWKACPDALQWRDAQGTTPILAAASSRPLHYSTHEVPDNDPLGLWRSTKWYEETPIDEKPPSFDESPIETLYHLIQLDPSMLHR